MRLATSKIDREIRVPTLTTSGLVSQWWWLWWWWWLVSPYNPYPTPTPTCRQGPGTWRCLPGTIKSCVSTSGVLEDLLHIPNNASQTWPAVPVCLLTTMLGRYDWRPLLLSCPTRKPHLPTVFNLIISQLLEKLLCRDWHRNVYSNKSQREFERR